MNRAIPILIMLALFSGVMNAQEPANHLKKNISIQLEDTRLRDALPKIAEEGEFQFSYNSMIIPGDSIISLDVANREVDDVLEDLLGRNLKWKVLGNHVIILPGDNTKLSKSERQIEYTLTGYIYDAVTGEIISSASIYDVDERLVSATNQEDFYSINLPSSQQERLISYSKRGYNDTLIVIRPSEAQTFNISLRPLPAQPGELTLEALPPSNLHDRTLVAALVPARAITASENIPVIEERFAQVSFLPFVGSNHVASGLITNRVSVNLLAGYSEGTRGLELGGMLNIDRNNMDGVQLGGFGNIVGNKTTGLQVGGFFNINGGSLHGWQMAGFSNVVMDTIKGVQLAGFANTLRGPMYGPQISGFANFTSQNVDGLQISGFSNIALGDVKFAQVSGFANFGAGDVKMVQGAGFTNVALGDVDFAQVSGFANYANNVGGLQASGLANIVSGKNDGVQAAGLLNYAGELNGIQVAAFNICDTVSAGVPIGILSFVRKGYHSFEFSADEIFWGNLYFKTGVRKFYNILAAGLSNDAVHGGYGLGSQISFTDRLKLSMDLTTSFVFHQERPLEDNGFLFKFSPKLDFELFSFLTITAGPSLNVFADINLTDSEAYDLPLLFSFPVMEKQYEYSILRGWIGATVGFRLF